MARSGGSAPPEARDSTPLAARVFAALCDGRFHSGEQLARFARGEPLVNVVR